MSYGITTVGKENDNIIHYYVQWSPLKKADKYEINAKVPAVAGIFEIYWMDETKKLRLYNVGLTHYGGLRSELRRLTDPELLVEPEVRKLFEEKEIWYRYAPCESTKVMADVVWFFMKTYFPDNPRAEHSGRYEIIYLKESEPDKLMWVP
jgi:hypothetical protein